MGPFAALLLAVTPTPAPLPPGVRAVAGAQVEILKAERVRAAVDPGGVHRQVRRVPGGAIVDFE